MKKFITTLVMVCFLSLITLTSSGCFTLKKGATEKFQHVDSEGLFQERHSSWEWTDPVTATKDFLGCLVSVNISGTTYSSAPSGSCMTPQGAPVGMGLRTGRRWDYTYNRWCDDDKYLIGYEGNVYEVPKGCTVSRNAAGKVVIDGVGGSKK